MNNKKLPYESKIIIKKLEEENEENLDLNQ